MSWMNDIVQARPDPPQSDDGVYSCLGTVKSKLKMLLQTVILDKWIPTTKLCPDCGKLLDLSLTDRTVKCSCGYVEDRDIHSAKNMIFIAKSCFKDNSVPMEHREVTLMEFRASALGSNAYEKAGTKK